MINFKQYINNFPKIRSLQLLALFIMTTSIFGILFIQLDERMKHLRPEIQIINKFNKSFIQVTANTIWNLNTSEHFLKKISRDKKLNTTDRKYNIDSDVNAGKKKIDVNKKNITLNKHLFKDNSNASKIHEAQNIPYDIALKAVADVYPNFPVEFWKKNGEYLHSLGRDYMQCALFPSIYNLDILNVYWQFIHMSQSTTVYLYSAYYDKREISPGKDIRILAMVNRTQDMFPANRTFYCQLWFENENQPVIVKMNKLDYMWIDYWNSHTEGIFGPYLLGCSIPKTHEDKIPLVVSFVENPCDEAKNMLKVIYEETKEKSEFAVCVKGLDFFQTDLSLRLIEWIELVLLMGADKVFFYELEVHPNMRKVLDYYSELGKVDVRPISLPGKNVNIPVLQHEYLVQNNIIQCLDEIIPYNDCFYRNLYSYDYVAIFDIDEIILPVKDKNWHDLIKRTRNYLKKDLKIVSFTAQQGLFLDKMQTEGPYQNIPSYMHMLQHVYRSANFSPVGEYCKTIFSTNYTISCHNHWPIMFAPDGHMVDFRLADARMHHYRGECREDEFDCNNATINSVKDTNLWKFKDKLIPRVVKVVKSLDL